MHELQCPICDYIFNVEEDYDIGTCLNCGKSNYYWDSVYDEDSGEEFFEGYYWDTKK
jgi:hypothetical protein